MSQQTLNSTYPLPLSAISPRAAVETVDFDLNGLAGVRLVNPSPADLAAAQLRLGSRSRPLLRRPDLTLRFVERLPLPDGSRLGLQTAFTEDSFYLRRSRQEHRATCRLPLDRLGNGADLMCEHGMPLPLFADLLNLTVLARGGLALQASAIEYAGRGCVFVGWPHGSMTAALIGMMAAGARFVAEQWCYLHPNGHRVFGMREPLAVPEQYLRAVPEYRNRLTGSMQTRLGVYRAVLRAVRAAEGVSTPGTSHARILGRTAWAVEQRLKVRIAPEALLGRAACAPVCSLDTVVLCVAHNRELISVRRMTPREAAPRILATLEYQRQRLQGYYVQFRCAFPDRWNPLLEQAAALEEQRLRRALPSGGVYVLQHPHDATPAALARVLEPLLSSEAALA